MCIIGKEEEEEVTGVYAFEKFGQE